MTATRLLFGGCAVLLAAGLCLSQGPSTQPAPAAAGAKVGAATQPAGAGGERITVVSVSGQARRCDASVEPRTWEPLRAGDVLTDLTLLHTGLDSAVVLNLGGRGEVRVGSATKIGVTEFRKDGALAKTSLGLKYGSIQAQVDSKTGPADFRVTTPTATLSVRGSRPEVSFGADVGTRGYSHEGLLSRVGPGSSQTVGPGEGTGDANPLPILAILQAFWAQYGEGFGLSFLEVGSLMTNGEGRGAFSGSGPQGFLGPYSSPASTPTPSPSSTPYPYGPERSDGARGR